MSMVPVLSPETIYKFMICAVTDCKCQGNFFCRGIYDFRLTVENERHRRLLDNLSPLYPPTPQKEQSRQEAIEENS